MKIDSIDTGDGKVISEQSLKMDEYLSRRQDYEERRKKYEEGKPDRIRKQMKSVSKPLLLSFAILILVLFGFFLTPFPYSTLFSLNIGWFSAVTGRYLNYWLALRMGAEPIIQPFFLEPKILWSGLKSGGRIPSIDFSKKTELDLEKEELDKIFRGL